MNTVLVHVSVYLLEWNISVPAYFGVPFCTIFGVTTNIYIYIYILLLLFFKVMILTNVLNIEV